jgi:two-component system chemotaxis response regulator CheY
MPEAVLLDWNMPVMDGLQFLKQCRAEHGPSQPIVVLCTTEAGIDRIVEALAAGAQEYIMKPFDAGILHDKFVQAGLLSDAA